MSTRTLNPRGISVLEIVIGVALISGALVALVTAFNLTVRVGFGHVERVEAAFLLEEGFEAVRYIRDSGWTSDFLPLTNDINYYIGVASSTWYATTAPSVIDGQFTRTVRLSSVYRRTSDSDIVPATSTASKTLDPNARMVTVTVSWNGGNTRTRSGTTTAVTYFTNLFND